MVTKEQGNKKIHSKLISDLEKVRKIINSHMPFIRREVEEIITSRDRNGARIEQTLDTLLSCMQMSIGEREFIMLNEYYAGVDKKGYEFYNKEYKNFLTDNYIHKPK
jgi:hypothetical protein